MPEKTRAAVVTVSDRCSAGARDDRSGPEAVQLLEAAGYAVFARVVPDGAASVANALRAALDSGARLVVTSGGTGVGPRDRTPEGTREVVDREVPGLAELLRADGVRHAPHAAVSRAIVGVVDGPPGALVVNLPGKPAAVTQGLELLLPLVPHILDQLSGGDH